MTLNLYSSFLITTTVIRLENQNLFTILNQSCWQGLFKTAQSKQCFNKTNLGYWNVTVKPYLLALKWLLKKILNRNLSSKACEKNSFNYKILFTLSTIYWVLKIKKLKWILKKYLRVIFSRRTLPWMSVFCDTHPLPWLPFTIYF